MITATCSVEVRVDNRESSHSQLLQFDFETIPALPSIGHRFFLRGLFSPPITNILWLVNDKGSVVRFMIELETIETDSSDVLEELKRAGFKESDCHFIQSRNS